MSANPSSMNLTASGSPPSLSTAALIVVSPIVLRESTATRFPVRSLGRRSVEFLADQNGLDVGPGAAGGTGATHDRDQRQTPLPRGEQDTTLLNPISFCPDTHGRHDRRTALSRDRRDLQAPCREEPLPRSQIQRCHVGDRVDADRHASQLGVGLGTGSAADAAGNGEHGGHDGGKHETGNVSTKHGTSTVRDA